MSRTPSCVSEMNRQAGVSGYLRRQPDEASSSSSTHPPNIYLPDDLPITVVRRFGLGSQVTSMDFHPQQHAVLVVGTNVGDISLWNVGSQEMLLERTFEVWKISACSMPFLITWTQDATISVNKCAWSPDGSILAVAFSKHIAQIYTYDPAGELRPCIEIDAHIGGVNDIAFATPNGQHCIITCGDDKTIKVWNVTSLKRYTYEGHGAPVYSVCPHCKDNIQFFLSTSTDGKIKVWLYDSSQSIVDCGALGLWCTRMAYSANGTSNVGISHLVELDETTEGGIKRIYSGLRRRTLSVVQFDTTKNHFLAAGDDSLIKFWDMNNTNMLTLTDADGGLPECPSLRFNKEGSLLAVATFDCGIKILANADGQRMLRTLENRVPDGTSHRFEPIDTRLTL